MRTGRPRTPTALKILRGNPGKRPLPVDEPTPEPRIPPCPHALDKVARAEWRRIASEVRGLRFVTALDRAALAVYCQSWSEWVRAQEGLAKHGLLVKTPNGYPIQSPLVSIANRAAKQMLEAAGTLGLTPSARARLGVARPMQKKANPFEALG